MSDITQKYIAEKLNLSRVTVTRALLNDPRIAESTRNKVQEFATKHGYVPNFVGRNLASKRSNTIGLSLPKINHSFFANVTEAIFKECKEKGYNVIPMISFENHEQESENLKTLLSMQIDGIIANISVDTRETKVYEMIRTRKIPIVFFDRVIDNGHFDVVILDDEKSGYNAVMHAVQNGYKKFAHLAGYSHINIGYQRLKGFKNALIDSGIPVRDEWIIQGGFDQKDGYNGAMKLLQASDRPDFIFAFNDIVAKGVYEAAAELDISIPEQLGVIGFGNLELGTLLNPTLTTIDIPIEKLAGTTVKQLINKIKDPKCEKTKKVIKTQIVVRRSCARSTR